MLNEAAGYINAKRREDLADDALAGTMATVVISPEGMVRVEVAGTGYFRSEQAFVDAVRMRQSQIMGKRDGRPRAIEALSRRYERPQVSTSVTCPSEDRGGAVQASPT